MISAALLSRPGQSETVSWQAGCTAKTPSTEGLFDSFLRRAGRAHSRKEPKSRLTMPGILQVRRIESDEKRARKPAVVCGNRRVCSPDTTETLRHAQGDRWIVRWDSGLVASER